MADFMYIVTGMTCQHCANAVSEAIAAIPTVDSVDVDVTSGHVRVSSGASLNHAAVRAAVADAGYTLVLP